MAGGRKLIRRKLAGPSAMARNTATIPMWMPPKPRLCTSCWSAKSSRSFTSATQQGIPTQWIAMMRESMARLTPVFSANRTVREYTEKHYLPGAAAYCARAAEHGKAAAELLQWQRTLSENWAHIRFGQLQVETADGQHVFEVQVYLDDVNADAVRVELYADRNRLAISRSGKRCSAGMSCLAPRAAMPTRHRCPPRGRRATTRRAWFPSKPAHSCRWRRTRSYGSDEI